MKQQVKSNTTLQRMITTFSCLLILLFCFEAHAGQGCNSDVIPIPANSTGITSSVVITGSSETLQDLNVRVLINHPDRGELRVSLKHVETGTEIDLVQNPSLGTGNCAASNINSLLFDDESTNGSIQVPANCKPLANGTSVVPSEPLSVFTGESFDGTWTLTVKDLAIINNGTLRNFCVFSNSTDLEIESTLSAYPVPGNSNFLWSLKVTNNGPYIAKNAGVNSSFVPANAGASLVSAFSSKGTVSVTGLPANANLQGNFGDLNVNESVTVDVELESFGVPGYEFEKRLKVRPKLPNSLPFEFFTVPVVYDETTHPSGVSGNIVLVEDGNDAPGGPGSVGSVNDACQPLTNAAAVNGNIALINARYPIITLSDLPMPAWAACTATTQINNAADAGATGVILAGHHDINYVPSSPPVSLQPGPVPAAAIGLLDYNLLVDALDSSATVNISLENDYPLQWWPTLDILDAKVTLDNNQHDIAELDRSNNYVMAPFACSYDKDKDLAADSVERCPEDANKSLPGQCGCGNPDTDSDGDGVAVCSDSCPTDANKIAPGVCGCGIADKDSDGDKTLDCNEQCPADPAKTSPGVCGCGIPDTDSNGDSIIDCKVTQEFKALVVNAKSLVSQMKASKKKSKAVRDLLKAIKGRLLSIAQANVNSIKVTSSSVRLVRLTKKAKRQLNKALKVKKKKFRRAKKRVAKTLKRLIAAIA